MELVEIYSGTGDLDKAAAMVSVLRKLDQRMKLCSTPLTESIPILSPSPCSAYLWWTRIPPACTSDGARTGEAREHAEAIENYRAALKIDPQLPGLHFELADMLNTLSTTEGRQEAEKEYKAALEVNPSDEQRNADWAI